MTYVLWYLVANVLCSLVAGGESLPETLIALGAIVLQVQLVIRYLKLHN